MPAPYWLHFNESNEKSQPNLNMTIPVFGGKLEDVFADVTFSVRSYWWPLLENTNPQYHLTPGQHIKYVGMCKETLSCTWFYSSYRSTSLFCVNCLTSSSSSHLTHLFKSQAYFLCLSLSGPVTHTHTHRHAKHTWIPLACISHSVCLIFRSIKKIHAICAITIKKRIK